jgi:hypothetical protein
MQRTQLRIQLMQDKHSKWGRGGRDRVVVRFTTTYSINTYHY